MNLANHAGIIRVPLQEQFFCIYYKLWVSLIIFWRNQNIWPNVCHINHQALCEINPWPSELYIKKTFLCCSNDPHRASSFTKLLDHTQQRTTSVGLLLTSDQLVAETSTGQHSQQADIHTPGGIRTHNLSTQAAADLRLSPRGHWNERVKRHRPIKFRPAFLETLEILFFLACQLQSHDLYSENLAVRNVKKNWFSLNIINARGTY
jgi:hypothetical protein